MHAGAGVLCTPCSCAVCLTAPLYTPQLTPYMISRVFRVPQVINDDDDDMDPRTLEQAAARLAAYTSEERQGAAPAPQVGSRAVCEGCVYFYSCQGVLYLTLNHKDWVRGLLRVPACFQRACDGKSLCRRNVHTPHRKPCTDKRART